MLQGVWRAHRIKDNHGASGQDAVCTGSIADLRDEYQYGQGGLLCVFRDLRLPTPPAGQASVF